MLIEVYSDILCPWCFIGKRRLEKALARLPEGAVPEQEEIEVRFRSFELNPAAPARISTPLPELLAKKYGMSASEAEAAIDRIETNAREEGLAYRLRDAVSGNSFDAHRLLHFAARQGRQHEVKEALMQAYMSEGKAISSREVLVGIASGCGLDADQVEAMLLSDAYAAEVRADEENARRLGVTGVPFFVVDGRFGIAGAQPPEAIVRTLVHAFNARKAEAPAERDAGAKSEPEGAACGPDGCAIEA